MSAHELHIAVKTGDLKRVNELLSGRPGNPDINEPDRKHWTPLMYAVYCSEASTEMLQTLLSHGASIDQTSVSYALGDLSKLKMLVEVGVDLLYEKEAGYDALINAACGRDVLRNPELIEILKVLIAKGVRLRGMTTYGESAVRVLSRIGRFDAVQFLLNAGANPDDVKLTPLHEAVVFGSLDEVSALLRAGAGLEDRDYWERTPWLMAIQIGDIAKAKMLLEHGADRNARGRCDKPSLFYAINNNHIPMLKWLLELGADVEQTDKFGDTPLREAVDHENQECVEVLLGAGANVDRDSKTGTALGNASTRTIALRLMDAGADPKNLTGEAKRHILGFSSEPDPDLLHASQSEVMAYRSRIFGKSNPEDMTNPFWDSMIRSGVSAFHARELLGIPEKFQGKYTDAWCANRFGQSLTFLPDGRIVQVGGEHEDHYDPDFCIYNDVFVHLPDGRIVVYGYPDSAFPPTDFHTATLIGDQIYLIGSLGYPAARRHGQTQVYRLDTTTFKIEPLQTTGQCPGWIYNHRAAKSATAAEVRVSGGEILSRQGDHEAHSQNVKVFVLDVESKTWRVE